MADAKLIKDRMTDQSDGPDVVTAHNDLEDALTKILGIPPNRDVNSAIMGTVQSDGQITLMRFSGADVASDPNTAVGFEFYDGDARKRFCLVDSHVQLWEADDPNDEDTDWTFVYDYEVTDEPALTDFVDVEIGTPIDGYVVGTSVGLNGELRFVLLQNVVATDGMQEFKEMADVSSDFTNIYGGGGFQYLNHLVGVKDTTQLGPVALEDDGNELFCAMSAMMELGLVDNTAGGTLWTTMAFSEIYQRSTITSLNMWGDLANAGIPLPAGIYRATVLYKIFGADEAGWISWKIVGAQGFPQGKIQVQHAPYEIFNNEPWAVYFQAPEDVYGTNGGWGYQEAFVIVPTNKTVALQMGTSDPPCSCKATLTLARIV